MMDLKIWFLHLHIHFVDQYKQFGSLAHLGSFGQESLIGYISFNRQGSRFIGDTICRNYSIDVLMHNKLDCKYPSSSIQMIDRLFDQYLNSDLFSNYSILSAHSNICGCSTANDSLKLFRRCVIRRHVYHSMHCTKRQKSVSFFIRYRDSDNPVEYRFGKIIIFFKYLTSSYAFIERYPVIQKFSELLPSPHYRLLHKPVNELFFIISQTRSSNLEPILLSRILDHCIVFDCIEYQITTPVSSYDEHD